MSDLIHGVVGGISGDTFGIKSPFEIALILMIIATFYSALCLPYVAPTGASSTAGSPVKGFAALMGPTRMLLPQLWILPSGQRRKQWGAPLLAWGVYLGVLATGYIPVLIQMYSMSAFGFSPAEVCIYYGKACVIQDSNGLAEWLPHGFPSPDPGLLPVLCFPCYHLCWSQLVFGLRNYQGWRFDY